MTTKDGIYVVDVVPNKSILFPDIDESLHLFTRVFFKYDISLFNNICFHSMIFENALMNSNLKIVN